MKNATFPLIWTPCLVVVLSLFACREISSDTDGGVDGGGPVDPAFCNLAQSQGPSEPCCLSHGIDACGAGLFCAAFEGRSTPTCYVERTQMDGEECLEDRHCVSGGCNAEMRACQFLPGSECDKSIGCAPDPTGTSTMVCVSQYLLSTSNCVPTTGQTGQPCSEAAHCDSRICAGSSCQTGRAGSDCEEDSHCLSEICVQGQCSNGGEGDRCGSGEDCQSTICVSSRCSRGDVGSRCYSDDQCVGGRCVGSRQKQCTQGQLHEPCGGADDCDSGICIQGSCASGQDGQSCSSDAHCAQSRCIGGSCGGRCRATAECPASMACTPDGECVDPGLSGPGVICQVHEQCRSGVCVDYDGISRCMSPQEYGAPCRNSEDCAEYTTCDDGICLIGQGRLCHATADGDLLWDAECASSDYHSCSQADQMMCEESGQVCSSSSDCGAERCLEVSFCS